jgi:hypothetical protein
MCLLLIEDEEKVAAFIKRGLVGDRARSVRNSQNGAMLSASAVLDFFHPMTEKGSSQPMTDLRPKLPVASFFSDEP